MFGSKDVRVFQKIRTCFCKFTYVFLKKERLSVNQPMKNYYLGVKRSGIWNIGKSFRLVLSRWDKAPRNKSLITCQLVR